MMPQRLSAADYEVSARKLVLGTFKTREGKLIREDKSMPNWAQVDYHLISVDDRDQIYVLNLWNNEILVYDGRGTLRNRIPLKVKLYREEYRNGSIIISGDGEQFLIQGLNDKGLNRKLIVDKTGTIKREFHHREMANLPDVRHCDGRYRFRKAGYMYDAEFRKEKSDFTGFSDSEGIYVSSLHAKELAKYSMSGKLLWKRKFYGYIAGIDKNGFVYATGSPRQEDPLSLYKIDAHGRIIARASIPDTFPLLTDEERDERDLLASEHSLSEIVLTCNGDAYMIFRLFELPKRTFQRWLKGGEYFIYKFEMSKPGLKGKDR
jgi:hypothetical protein